MTRQVFGEPYERPDGTVVIPVARAAGTRWGTARAIGVFVIHDGKATWVPAVDTTRVTSLALSIGLVAAFFSTIAMVRRPPWPNVSIRMTRHES
ncbi:hypothetical protein [Actinocrispum wychmicini]|uniref:hypothetical protein n=1 Tax=Actinocrispum wychmicini TaxID=1213861 RepID=UPI001FB64158|nr:hypothetical protein [Actinocrispum wychmicini]